MTYIDVPFSNVELENCLMKSMSVTLKTSHIQKEDVKRADC